MEVTGAPLVLWTCLQLQRPCPSICLVNSVLPNYKQMNNIKVWDKLSNYNNMGFKALTYAKPLPDRWPIQETCVAPDFSAQHAELVQFPFETPNTHSRTEFMSGRVRSVSTIIIRHCRRTQGWRKVISKETGDDHERWGRLKWRLPLKQNLQC